MNFFDFQLFYLIAYNSAVYSLKNHIDLSILMHLINNQHTNKPLAGHRKAAQKAAFLWGHASRYLQSRFPFSHNSHNLPFYS